MKKILIAVLIVLLLILGFIVIKNGIIIGEFEILGYGGLVNKNEELEKKLREASQIVKVTFPQKSDELTSAAKQLVKAREQYQDKVAYSSEEDVRRAREIKSYQIDFLFTKLGNYQTKYGLDMDLAATETSATGVYNLNFTLHGNYHLISDFISAIENDSDLNFLIENFALVADSNNTEGRVENLKATFTVTNLKLVVDNTIRNSSESSPMADRQKSSGESNTTNSTRTTNTTSNTTRSGQNATNTSSNNTTGNTTNNITNNTTNNLTNTNNIGE